MKRFTLILLVLWIAFAFAVVPADYFIPLQVGNSLVFRAGETGTSWYPRTVYETIEGTDTISGETYYKLVGTEFMDSEPNSEHIFHVFWYREDSLRNILIRAVGMGGSRLLDSAMIYPMDYMMMFPEKCEPGYSFHYDIDTLRILDSTISNTETANTGTGTFNDCIKMMSYRTDSSGNRLWEEYVYYAENVGEVIKDRVYPDPHTNVLQQINFQTNVEKVLPLNFFLGQNYPNPFNPLTIIDYQIPIEGHVKICIYDLKGEKVNELVNMRRRAGTHKLIWHATDISSGVYIYTLEVDKTVIDRKKMILLK